MASFIDLGDKSSACLNVSTVSVDPSLIETVTVKNVSGDTLSYFSNLTSTAAGTLTPTNSQSFTTPVWIRSAGRTSVQLTGGKY